MVTRWDWHSQAPGTYPGSQAGENSSVLLGRLEYRRSIRTCVAESYRGYHVCRMIGCRLEEKLGDLEGEKASCQS